MCKTQMHFRYGEIIYVNNNKYFSGLLDACVLYTSLKSQGISLTLDKWGISN